MTSQSSRVICGSAGADGPVAWRIMPRVLRKLVRRKGVKWMPRGELLGVRYSLKCRNREGGITSLSMRPTISPLMGKRKLQQLLC